MKETNVEGRENCGGNVAVESSVASPRMQQEESEWMFPKDNQKIETIKSDDSDEEDAPVVRIRRRMHQFCDSDSESNNENLLIDESDNSKSCVNERSPDENLLTNQTLDKQVSSNDDDSNENIFKQKTQESRLHKLEISENSSESSHSDSNSMPSKNDNKKDSRIKAKRNQLRDKFKSLVSKRTKENKSESVSNEEIFKTNEDSQSSDREASSIEKIREKIKERTMQIKSSIYDPDTSDEEVNRSREISKPKQQRKSTKPISPKPMRISAKQAMENMQKIKSESNRMLREKEVSLPYHRPKALSLQAILSKRRPAVSADGKALPIKMNEEQLRQYAQQLEERQKEVIELCKSDSEGECPENEVHENKDTEEIIADKTEIKDTSKRSTLNDTLYDDLAKTESSQDKTSSKLENIGNEFKIISSVENDIRDIDEEHSDVNPVQNNKAESKEENVEKNSMHTNSFDFCELTHERDKNNSTEMELFYNDSVEDSAINIAPQSQAVQPVQNLEINNSKKVTSTEVDSQLISLHYDTEKTESNSENHGGVQNVEVILSEESNKDSIENANFSDDDLNMDVIDALIENAEVTLITGQNINSPLLIKEPDLTKKPKLYGAPGMVIDLDGTDPLAPKKLSGVELLRERYVFFSNLKTPEELEREKEKKLKPGMQHLRLKQELQEQIAEQRSLEWAKRLEEERQQKKEQGAIRGDGSDAEDIDEIEAKLEAKEENNEKEATSSESEEEEEVEEEIVDKLRKRNPMVDDEAEESDCDEIKGGKQDNYEHEGNETDKDGNDGDDEEESEESSDESEDEQQKKPKKGRILKAFEDSDDEESPKIIQEEGNDSKRTNDLITNIETTVVSQNTINAQAVKESQDDVIQLAQKSVSEDLFTSQDSRTTKSGKEDLKILNSLNADKNLDDNDLGTQTFSILETNAKHSMNINLTMPEKNSIPSDTQLFFDDNLDAVVGMCSGSFSQNLVPPSQISDVPASQVIGEDVLALCTGQFYNNQFVSQLDVDSKDVQTDAANTLDLNEKSSDGVNIIEANNMNNEQSNRNEKYARTSDIDNKILFDDNISKDQMKENSELAIAQTQTKKAIEDPTLKSILDELNDPIFDSPKPNKYFVGDTQDKENSSSIVNAQFKKKFVIDSDDDETEETPSSKKKKQIKKKKLEQRALQISDDEEEDVEPEEEEEYESETALEDEKRVVEYDSDENEVIVQPQNPKKKRKLAEFFENEAELTSEDEWVGSGDEDEAGLDRMEREEGDDDTFNQNQLQRELGQIHMRDVLDQDKREVRLIQELLFEDGDLGGGSRQRKFRWKNADGDEETGTVNDEFADTQEEEFESEEQWRKQRHEREMFLRSLKTEDENQESLNISVSRTSIIKANLSRNSSSLFVEVNTSVEKTESPVVEKKTAKDIPSPKKPFGIFQQNYHNSLLTRGGGALARLAALATPLAADDDTPKGSLVSSSKRNFVFAALDHTEEEEPRVTKRKADTSVGTPRLVKKLRTEDKQKQPKSSLLDHLKV